MSGPECCSNPPTLNPSSGASHVDKLGALNAYITGSPNSNSAVLLVSDVFGYEAPNLSFGNLLYDYLNKRGLSEIAEAFLKETQLTGQIPADFDAHPHGFLYRLWTVFCGIRNSGQQQMLINQLPNVAAIAILNMNATSQIIQDRYTIRQLLSFTSGAYPWQTISSCDFSSDGKFVASGGQGGQPYVCNMETNRTVTTLETHSSSITEVRFQPGSTRFATSSYGNTVKLWDADRLEEGSVFEFVGHNGTVRSLDFHPSKGILCSSGTDDVIKVWDVNQRIMIKEFKAGGSKVRFQPNSGQYLAVANKNVLNILDFEKSTVVKRFQGHDKVICSICWDISGQWIASASEEDISVWSLGFDSAIYRCSTNGKKLKSIIFHPRYHNVLVIGSLQGMDLLVIEVGRLRITQASDVAITGLAACLQNELIASTSRDSVVNIWK